MALADAVARAKHRWVTVAVACAIGVLDKVDAAVAGRCRGIGMRCRHELGVLVVRSRWNGVS